MERYFISIVCGFPHYAWKTAPKSIARLLVRGDAPKIGCRRRAPAAWREIVHMTEKIHLPIVTITSDGAARGNPGPGGWAALLQREGKEKLLSGEHPDDTTNNAMELLAVISALEAL